MPIEFHTSAQSFECTFTEPFDNRVDKEDGSLDQVLKELDFKT